MTLLQIIYEVNVGIGRIAENIGLVAMNHGWDSYITYARGYKASASKTIKIGTTKDVYLHAAKSILFDSHGLGSSYATKTLLRKIDNIQPDAIILHNLHGYYLNYKMLFEYLSSKDIPVYWILHDCWAFTGHCAYFEYMGCEKWKSGCNGCTHSNSYPKAIVSRSEKNFSLKKQLFTSLNRLTIVPVSDWLGNLVKESFLKELPMQVIHNGVDTKLFNPSQTIDLNQNYGTDGKKYILGCAAIWCDRKGMTFFEQLATMLPEEYQLIMVGLDAKQIKMLPSNIIRLGKTDSVQELAQIYAGADVFINPTLEDNFPSTNIEALACGTPVITFNTGGSIEAVSEGTGVIVEQGDVFALKDAIVEVCSKGKGHYSEACRKRAEELYDKDKCFKKYLDLISIDLGMSY